MIDKIPLRELEKDYDEIKHIKIRLIELKNKYEPFGELPNTMFCSLKKIIEEEVGSRVLKGVRP